MCFSFLCLLIFLSSRKKEQKHCIYKHKIVSPTCSLLIAIRAGGNLQILLWLSTKIFTALLIPCLHPAIVLGPDKRRCKLPNMVNIVRSPRIRALYSRGTAALCVWMKSLGTSGRRLAGCPPCPRHAAIFIAPAQTGDSTFKGHCAL